jgi:hypothetical protein
LEGESPDFGLCAAGEDESEVEGLGVVGYKATGVAGASVEEKSWHGGMGDVKGRKW